MTPPETAGIPALRFPFDNTYARLPQRFATRLSPTPVQAPALIKVNSQLATFLGLDPVALATPEGAAILAGNQVAEGSEPLAMAYAGHQFGHFVPQLGDGRTNLLGELIGQDGIRYDIQLKGSGPTPFSRRGDGRAALGPVLREYLLSEAMHALGVPTTRALAAVSTGERVFRETPMPGAILTRVAASHLRVGTFQYFAAQGDIEGLRTLADYAISRHYPAAAEAPKPYLALLENVIARQAALIARWMNHGFIHGVMNTDNTSISGETIDYGPCAFLEAYEPAKVFSSIDQMGRYAYSNQPRAAQWNLMRLAEALLPILLEDKGAISSDPLDASAQQAAVESANAALASFAPQFEAANLAGLRRKLGFATELAEDEALANNLLDVMAANQADFTLTFRYLSEAASAPISSTPGPSASATPSPRAEAKLRALFADPAAFDAWAIRWRQRLEVEPDTFHGRSAGMLRTNPLFIPRNHLVEFVITAAVSRQDFQPFEELLDIVTHPFETPNSANLPGTGHPDSNPFDRFSRPARPDEAVLATFCGT